MKPTGARTKRRGMPNSPRTTPAMAAPRKSGTGSLQAGRRGRRRQQLGQAAAAAAAGGSCSAL